MCEQTQNFQRIFVLNIKKKKKKNAPLAKEHRNSLRFQHTLAFQITIRQAGRRACRRPWLTGTVLRLSADGGAKERARGYPDVKAGSDRERRGTILPQLFTYQDALSTNRNTHDR